MVPPLYTETSGWRDPSVLLSALAPGPDDDALTVDPSGESACTLAIAGARRVVAVLPHFPDYALLSLRLAAVRELPVQSVRSLFGLGDFGRRLWFYHHVRARLSLDVRRFWDEHEEDVRLGLGQQGRTEAAVRMFRDRLLPWLVPPEAPEAWFTLKTLHDQRRVWRRDWNGLRLRAALEAVERRGREPSASKLPPWRTRVERMFTEVPARDHFILQQVLLGRALDLERAAPAWSTAGHASLRAALDRIELVDVSAMEALSRSRYSCIDLHTFTDSGSPGSARALTDAAAGSLPPRGRMLAWSILRPLPATPGRQAEGEAALFRMDRSLLTGELGCWTR